MSNLRFTTHSLPAIAVGLVVLLAALTAATAVATAADAPVLESNHEDDRSDQFEEETAERTLFTDVSSVNGTPSEPIEDRYEDPAPEEGDPGFEAEASDGSWISYMNPRDYYREPYLGDGSGKICVALVNEHGDPVEGESVPDTSVTIQTGESLAWHPHADPFTVEYPLTEHYDTPLDGDQFGTAEDLPQGDGYMDSHCLEFHGLPEDGEIEYGEVEVDGEHADWIEVVGYLQVENEAWDSDVDPIEDAEPYEAVGGSWEYEPDESHGQVIAVLQLDPPEDAYPEGVDIDASDDSDESDDANGADGSDDGDDSNGTDDGADSDGAADGDDDAADSSDEADELPGFGALVAAVALAATIALLVGRRR